jgi:hypothetical protein
MTIYFGVTIVRDYIILDKEIREDCLKLQCTSGIRLVISSSTGIPPCQNAKPVSKAEAECKAKH